MFPLRQALLLASLFLLPATTAGAIEFRDYYEPGEIAAYQAALKRKDFRAQIHWKPLIVAAADNGDINTVRWMLENNVRADVADSTGRTGLFHLASRNPAKIRKDYAEIARLLLTSGADPNRFASGTSVLRTLVSGNRDINTLQVLLAHGADANGNPKDIYPPVCGAATPEFVDTLVAAGAQLQFADRSDANNVADCIALDDVDRKERKVVLKHLATVYGIVPTGERAATPAQPVPPPLLPAGSYLYSEQTHARPAWGEQPAIIVDYATVAVAEPMTRAAIIDNLVRPQGFRREKWIVSTPALQRCATADCSAEIAEWRAFAERNRLPREFVMQQAGRPEAGREATPVVDAIPAAAPAEMSADERAETPAASPAGEGAPVNAPGPETSPADATITPSADPQA